MANNNDFRVKHGLVVSTTATVLGTTSSTSTETGALIVSGGVGIGQSLYVGGEIYRNNTLIGYGYSGSGGYTGSIGYTGSQGDLGYLGSIGYTGSQGDLGYSGSIGYTGSQGDLGYLGSIGYTGSQGDLGYSGSIGYTGSQGDLGYSGSIGYTGSQGDLGYLGSIGYTGSTGYTGSQGNDGTSVTIIGNVSTYTNLPGYPSSYMGSTGDGYLVNDTGHLWVWSGTTWVDVGEIRGPQGDSGYSGSIGYTGSRGPGNALTAASEVSSATLYPVMVGALDSVDQTPKGNANFYFNAATDTLNVVGTIVANTLTIQYTTITTVEIITDDVFTVLNQTNSTSTLTGALVVRGGVGIGKNLYVGGQIVTKVGTNSAPSIILDPATPQTGFLAGAANLAGDTIDAIIASSVATRTNAMGFHVFNNGNSSAPSLIMGSNGYGGLFTSGLDYLGVSWASSRPAAFYAAGTSSTSTTTGALVVSGGVGVSQNLYVGGSIYSNGNPIGASITDDTTTNSDLFPTFATTSTGTLSTVYTSSTKYKYNPSTGQLTAVDINTTSDQELKENISTITDPVTILKQLRGVSFSWKENGRKSYGVIAQELEKILPELVGTDGRNYKSVAYLPLIGFLIEAIKQQQDQIDQLTQRL